MIKRRITIAPISQGGRTIAALVSEPVNLKSASFPVVLFTRQPSLRK